MMVFLEQNTLAVTTILVMVVVLGLRNLYWRTAQPVRTCDTCGHTAKVKRIIPGKWYIEYPVIALGFSVGLVVHLVLIFAVVMLLWRTLASYVICTECGSERLEKPMGDAVV